MPELTESWTNQQVLDKFLWELVDHIHKTAPNSISEVRDAAYDENPNRLKDRLDELQGSVVDRIFSLIDGSGAPTNWPGIKLVNAKTSETLTDNLAWELSRVEGEYIIATDQA